MADEAPKTKRLDLPERVTFNDGNGDKSYGPGKNVEVPIDFPLASDITEEVPTPERVFAKPTSSPPNTGGVDTGERNVPRVIEDTTLPVGSAPPAPNVPPAPDFERVD